MTQYNFYMVFSSALLTLFSCGIGLVVLIGALKFTNWFIKQKGR